MKSALSLFGRCTPSHIRRDVTSPDLKMFPSSHSLLFLFRRSLQSSRTRARCPYFLPFFSLSQTSSLCLQANYTNSSLLSISDSRWFDRPLSRLLWLVRTEHTCNLHTQPYANIAACKDAITVIAVPTPAGSSTINTSLPGSENGTSPHSRERQSSRS